MGQITKILHITDLHLFSNHKKKLVGINPFLTFQQVITKITNDIQQNQPDLIVLTGDISQDYSLSSYKTAQNSLQQLQSPIAATMGNHDYLPFFTKVFGNPTHIVTKTLHPTNWCILLLSSHQPQHVNGQLTESDLTFLKQSLAANSKQPVIIFLHHQILPVASAWIDKINLQNHEQFLEIIDQHKNVKAIVCGHVHQNTSTQRQDAMFLSTPATSWQFASNSLDFKLDTLMPGYRWLNLHEDGTIQTDVVRIEHNDKFTPDANSTGY